ncbi:hypothetical protein [Candidatus Uabimicrobium amorphum]|uniref:hypothetical protein n=1 Tax=Uabimicrobium amorphum TaxID=2596890 RepID=UPI0015650145
MRNREKSSTELEIVIVTVAVAVAVIVTVTVTLTVARGFVGYFDLELRQTAKILSRRVVSMLCKML